MFHKVSAFVSPFHIKIHHLYHDYQETEFFRSRKLAIVNLSPKSSGTPPLPNTSDPFLLLGLMTATADQRQIKRAYRRRALQYHPDVLIAPDSTPEEKKKASDDFAKINAAYALLSGTSSNVSKRKSKSSSTTKPGSGTSASKTKSSSYDPTYRRTVDAQKNNLNWEDGIPQYDEDYNTNGDSFREIFNDIVAGATSSSSSSGILSDFISFLEGNNFTSHKIQEEGNDNSEFIELLKNGSIQELKGEMDDVALLTKQLEQKDLTLKKEYEDIVAQGSGGGVSRGSYLEEMRLEEQRREVVARREVVRDYLDSARDRRIKLRNRYEEIRYSRNEASWSSRTENKNRNNRSSSSNKEENFSQSWQKESFGSGRQRRRGSRPPGLSSPSSSPSSDSLQNARSTPALESFRNNLFRRSIGVNGNIPPHRRTSPGFKSLATEKRRLREITVEEEIDKMKRELGL